MADIAPIPPAGATARTHEAGPKRSQAAAPAAATRPADRVDLSDQSRLLSRLASLPDIRQDLVDRVKAEIAAGNYVTDDKIEVAVDGLLEDLA